MRHPKRYAVPFSPGRERYTRATRLALLSLASLLISACVTNGSRTYGTRASDGLYNRVDASCNQQGSYGEWHSISTAFGASDFRLIGAYPTQFYFYLVHDPTPRTGDGASLRTLRGLTRPGRVHRDDARQVYTGVWPLFDGRPTVGPGGLSDPLIGLSIRPLYATFFLALPAGFVETLPAAARAAIPSERALAIPAALTDRYELSFTIEGQPPLQFEARANPLERTVMSKNRYSGKLAPYATHAGVAFTASRRTFTEELPTGTDPLSVQRTFSPELMAALSYLGEDFVRQDLGLSVTLKKGDVIIYREDFVDARQPGSLLNVAFQHFVDHVQNRKCF